MNTNIDKKQISKLNIGLDMLADRQQEYIKAIGEIALVLHSNALKEDTLKQPDDGEIANEFLGSALYFLTSLDLKTCRYIQEKLSEEAEISMN